MRRLGIILFLCAASAAAQGYSAVPTETFHRALARQTFSATTQAGIIRRVEFAGLRRISPAALRAKIQTREGEPLDAQRIQEDVRALENLGWFESVSVEVEELPLLLALHAAGAEREGESDAQETIPMTMALRVTFVLTERPFLARVKFQGSRLLRREQIEEILAGAGVRLRIAAPCQPTELWRAKRALQLALAEMGHPLANVRMKLAETAGAAVEVRFNIQDGPRVPVVAVDFEGNEAIRSGELRKQMRNIRPDARLAAWRGTDIYTPGRYREDAHRLETYYRNAGFLEARVGEPSVELVQRRRWRWLPLPKREWQPVYEVSIPVREGDVYSLVSATVVGSEEAMAKAAPALAQVRTGKIFSERELLDTKAAIEVLLEKGLKERGPVVELKYYPDRERHTVAAEFEVKPAPRYVIRRVELEGHRRFSERFYLQRLRLKEGELYDPANLEAGVERLVRSGWVRPVTPRDIDVRLDDERKLADIKLRVQETGRQRIALSGGPLGRNATFGLAYSVFNLLGGEELLTAQLDGGPESVSVFLGVAREGIFGTPATAGLQLYRQLFRPKLQSSEGRTQAFSSLGSGIRASWEQRATPHSRIRLDYDYAQTTTQYPAAGTSQPAYGDVWSRSARSAVSLIWRREAGQRQTQVESGVAGGWLGGDERSVRAAVVHTHALADPLSGRRNTWSFRGHAAGVASYSGAALPLTARLLPGPEWVRGFRGGEITPFVVRSVAESGGGESLRVESRGANLFTGANAEYRVPLARRTEVTGFLDAGSSWLIADGLGAERPQILGGTNGAWRASTGIELRVKLPWIEEHVRLYYAMNPLRLGESWLLPDGSRFRASERRAVFGWAIGKLF
jgi:outer membrane protein assembly complex protein YaeT